VFPGADHIVIPAPKLLSILFHSMWVVSAGDLLTGSYNKIPLLLCMSSESFGLQLSFNTAMYDPKMQCVLKKHDSIVRA